MAKRKKKKRTYTEQISCRVTKHVYGRFDQIAEKEHRTQNDVIRALINLGLESYDSGSPLYEVEEEEEE